MIISLFTAVFRPLGCWWSWSDNTYVPLMFVYLVDYRGRKQGIMGYSCTIPILLLLENFLDSKKSLFLSKNSTCLRKRKSAKKKDLISLFLFASQSPQYARIWIEEYSSTFVPRKVSSRNTRFITDMQAKHIKSVIFLNRSFWTGTELEILLLQEGN